MTGDVERWLRELGIEPDEQAEREGIASWDMHLDGRSRTRLRVTLIFDPSLGVIAWAHYAPALNDSLRASYRQLLRWNDEYPFVKFSLAEDGRPMLSAEVPVERLDCEQLGLALARVLAVSDALLPASKGWLWPGGRGSMSPPRSSAGVALLTRFASRIGDVERE